MNTQTKNNVLNLVITFFLLLFSIILPFKFVLFFDALYNYDIHSLQLDKQLAISSDQLLQNYNTLIRYLDDSHVAQLAIPGFPMSENGLFHFQEVKRLFLIVNQLLCFSACLVLLGILWQWRKGWKPRFLRWTAMSLFLLPLILAIPFLLSFEKTFILFHRLLFNNQYWMFDPITDPIIYALPQEFFFHCGIVILTMMLALAVLYYLVYSSLKRKWEGG